MSTTVTQRIAGFLHLGKMPVDVEAHLQSEGRMLYLAEGIAETAILRNFKAPGTRCGYRRMGFVGFFALTERRILASARYFHGIRIDTAFNDPPFKQLEFHATPKYLSVTFDPSIHGPDMSGRIEIRLHLPDVATAARILADKGARLTAEGIDL